MPDEPTSGSAAPPYETRPVRTADTDFLERLYASTRTRELALLDWPDAEKERFLHLQFEAQRTHYAKHFPHADHDLLLLDGEPVGRVWVDRRKDEIRVLDMALLPEHRRRGIGAEILHRLKAEATERGVALTLSVEHNNPRAKRFYLHHGLVVVKDYETHELMAWTPNPGS